MRLIFCKFRSYERSDLQVHITTPSVVKISIKFSPCRFAKGSRCMLNKKKLWWATKLKRILSREKIYLIQIKRNIKFIGIESTNFLFAITVFILFNNAWQCRNETFLFLPNRNQFETIFSIIQ